VEIRALKPNLTEDLPAGWKAVAVLSETERGAVLRVRGAAGDRVLRIGAEGGAGIAAEASLFAQVNTPGLVPPEEWGRTPGGRPYLLRPFVEGRHFAEAAQSDAGDHSAAWVRSLLETLGALHAAGLLHRDLKSDNVLVGEQGVFIVDLDLVATFDGAQGGAGSRYHLAPEVLLGQPPSPASDLFSLGAMIAFATCGEPDDGFHRVFPARSFWNASGLDPSGLPGALAPLVRSLVRRHPGDRPASARDAARLIEGAEGLPPELALPPMAGRGEALDRVGDRVPADADDRVTLLIAIEDAEEEPGVLDALQLNLAVRGRRSAAWPIDTPHADVDRVLSELREEGVDVVLARGSALEGGVAPGAILVELVVASLLSGGGSAPNLLLSLSPAESRELTALLRRRALDEELAHLAFVSWPRVSQAELARHIVRLSDDSSPELAAGLARTLHRRTAGRLSEVNHLLRRAEEDGVLRRDGGSCHLLLSEWPEGPSDLRVEEALRVDLPAGARTLLDALACLGRRTPRSQALAVAGLDVDRGAEAVATLCARGLLQKSVDEDALLEAADPRSLDLARLELDTGQARVLHRCAADVLADVGAPACRVASQRLQAAADQSELLDVVRVAESELGHGRIADVRALLQELRIRHPDVEGLLTERLAVLEARLELAQGAARDARRALQQVWSDTLDAAPPAVLLLGAQIAEQMGERSSSRALYERVMEGPATRAEQLAALTGRGYGLFLDGAWEAVLDLTDGEPKQDDPDEQAATLLNLRGVALTRLGEHERAEACLASALKRCTHESAAPARARTALNIAHLDRRRGRYADAVASLEDAAAAFTEAGHVQGRALALNNLGVLHRDLGELAGAKTFLQEALALRRRVGEAHGAASSLGSYSLVELDAGEIGAALDTIERSRELLLRGDYRSELALSDLSSSIAHALVGRHADAANALTGPNAETARSEHPGLAARAAAVLHLLGGQADIARSEAESACRQAGISGELAEEFRANSLLVALQPEDAEAGERLIALAERIGSPVRRAEAAWRTRAQRDPPDAKALEGWLQLFDQAGRTDLISVVAQALAETLDTEGDPAARRAALARATVAGDALTDGLPEHERAGTLARLGRISGGDPVNGPGSGGLTVEWFLACNRRMASEQDLSGLLLTIVDMALELTGARRSFLVLLDGESVDVQVARGMDESDPEEASFSRTVVREAVATGAPVLSTDASSDSRFQSTESISSLALRSILCVPLKLPGERQGALYIDNDQHSAVFDETDAARVSSLADQAAVAITGLRRSAEIEALNHRLSERVEFQSDELERTRTLLRRKGRVAPVGGIVGESEAMQRVFALVEKLAPTDLPVLVTGPTGSGKDLVAQALHHRSRRADGPLVVENVAALPANLLESELFGHVRGAFTGADRDRPGLFAEADGGTFFLDEIGELPMNLQVKLLRVIESGEVRPVGGRRSTKVDVRIVAATNRDLLQCMRDETFREDLYYRLNAAEVRLPALADRIEDIPLLAQHFLDLLNEKHGTSKRFEGDVLAALVGRAWPGQVRELSNEVARLYFLSEESISDAEMVRVVAEESSASDPMPSSLRLEDVERAAILRALSASGQRKDKAAKMLGISRAGLYAKMKRLDVNKTGEGE
jgi:transcriptional regulator with GAF, ATPase, and Fis domain/tetratricopeptide (TPR) repeat protein